MRKKKENNLFYYCSALLLLTQKEIPGNQTTCAHIIKNKNKQQHFSGFSFFQYIEYLMNMNICLSVITIIIFSFCLIFTCHAIQKNIKNEETKPVIFIDLGLSSNPPTQQIRFAIQVCVGLANRNDKIIGPVYTLQGIDDLKWLQNTHNGNGKEKRTSSTDFLNYVTRSCIRLDGHGLYQSKNNIPNIVTLAAVEDAIPLEDNLLSLLDIDPNPTSCRLYEIISQYSSW